MPTSSLFPAHPEHQKLLVTMGEESKKHPLNLYISQIAVLHLIDVIGDDDLLFEIEEHYPHLTQN